MLVLQDTINYSSAWRNYSFSNHDSHTNEGVSVTAQNDTWHGPDSHQFRLPDHSFVLLTHVFIGVLIPFCDGMATIAFLLVTRVTPESVYYSL